jgi:hypothetical protein
VTHGALFGVFARHPGAEAGPLPRASKDGILRIRAQLTRLQPCVDSAANCFFSEEQHAQEWPPNHGDPSSRRHSSRLSRVRRLNPRRVKIHRNYTVEEVARLFGVHKNTVRSWLKAGLPGIDDRRPILVLGRQLVVFLYARRQHRRRRCRAGEFYCFRCRAPKRPASGLVEYLPLTAHAGNLTATCADCGARMYRRSSLRKLAAAAGDLEVALPQAQQRILSLSISRCCVTACVPARSRLRW